jgi:Family of unknown function (DUF6527)
MSDAKVEFETFDFDPSPPGRPERFGFKCPKQPGLRAAPSWIWDGNRDKPTFTPSINCLSCPGKWHGYIRAGRCVDTSGSDEKEP